MKLLRYALIAGMWLVASAVPALRAQGEVTIEQLRGAWRGSTDGMERVLLVVDGYWSYSIYDVASRTFVRTFGGPGTIEQGRVSGSIHFDSAEPHRVGEALSLQVRFQRDRLIFDYGEGQLESWERVDDGQGPLAGAWRFAGRVGADGQVQETPLRARRTLKLLSGDRFQWFAINIETGEFFGTGGGTYTFRDGTYTENIEFFSRDGSRVGASLNFEGEIRNDQWHHRGLSSRGDPIYELWAPLEEAGKRSREP
jgi:hypothetical protein